MPTALTTTLPFQGRHAMPNPRSQPPRPPSSRTAALDAGQLALPLFDPPPAAASPHPPAAPPVPSPASPFASPPSPGGARLRSLQLGTQLLTYRLKRSSRRTIGFAIDGTGLSVTAPRWVTLADIESAIADKQKWIFTKLAEWRDRVEQRALPRIVWCDGAQLPYLGRPLTIVLQSATGTLTFDADAHRLALGLPAHADEQQIKDRVQGWLQQQAHQLFAARLDVYAARLGVAYRRFALSAAATRWGSCSSDGRIRLNWRLIHFPLSIVDYVVAHELAHLREMNHGPRFWDAVASIFPEFREARHTLRHHPPALLPAF